MFSKPSKAGFVVAVVAAAMVAPAQERRPRIDVEHYTIKAWSMARGGRCPLIALSRTSQFA